MIRQRLKLVLIKQLLRTKKTTFVQKKEKAKTSLDKKKSDVIKQLNELDKGTNNLKNQVKNEIKNQLEQLLDLFKQTLPPKGGGALSTISGFFYRQRKKQKNKLKDF